MHEPRRGEVLEYELKSLVNSQSPTGNIDYFILPESSDFQSLPNQDKKNPMNAAKVELGKMLFFETGLALEPKYNASLSAYSCSSCHIPKVGFTAGRFQGIADGAVGFGISGEGRKKNHLYQGVDVDAQGARPLPTINLTFVTNALWAGSFGSFGVNKGTESVWHQDTLIEINFKLKEGLEANNERALAVHRQVINKGVTDMLGYTSSFDVAFPEYPESTRYSRETGGAAIAAYQRTILTNKAPFQLWLKGDLNAITENQKEGALLFFGKAGCVNCHKSPSFNNMDFHAVGVNNLYQSGLDVFRTDAADRRNLGRGGFTYREEDMNKFKVPQLYNLKDVGFYFHGASKKTLREVVEYFNVGVPENPLVKPSQMSPIFHPLGLSVREIDQLTDFIENSLFDADLERYAPIRTKSGNCFPDNDPQAQIDLGCK
ncbi:MAG: cytochrome c peroxidase [Saprospiraceae bacterium]